jgi:hypothetical protein
MFMQKATLASSSFKTISRIGISKPTLAGLLDILLNLFLFFSFRFNFWHVLASPYRRPYKKDLRIYLAKMENFQVIELGVGLGDNLQGISNSVGLERDIEVIRAAKSKNPEVHYQQFEFGVSSFSNLFQALPKYEKRILLAVNVLTGTQVKSLEKELSGLWGAELHYLIVDVVNEKYENLISHSWMPKKTDFTLNQVYEIATSDIYRRLIVFSGTKNAN